MKRTTIIALLFVVPLFSIAQKKTFTFDEIFKGQYPQIFNELPEIEGWADDTHYIEVRFDNQGNDVKYSVDVLTGKSVVYTEKKNNDGEVRDEEGKENETGYEQNKSLYSVMNLEKWAIYGILTMMLIVAAFTMIGALTMLVLEKQKDIQILKALGADNSRVRKIFLSEGLLLAGMGAGAGLLLAISICWAQVKYKLIAIEGGTFLIDYYPVELRFSDFLLVAVTVMLIAFLASWFPARRAALEPVQLKT